MTDTAAPTAEDLPAVLRAAGLRVTEQRLAALAALTGADGAHLSAEQVHDRVLGQLPATPLQSVYLVLGALTGAGLLRRIEPAGSAARYERRTGDNHHHVVCTVCGTIADVDCAVGHAPCLTPSSANGFTIATAEVTYWGLCERCADADDADADDADDTDAAAVVRADATAAAPTNQPDASTPHEEEHA